MATLARQVLQRVLDLVARGQRRQPVQQNPAGALLDDLDLVEQTVDVALDAPLVVDRPVDALFQTVLRRTGLGHANLVQHLDRAPELLRDFDRTLADGAGLLQKIERIFELIYYSCKY